MAPKKLPASTKKGIYNQATSQQSGTAPAANPNQTAASSVAASQSTRPSRSRRLTEKARNLDEQVESDDEGAKTPSSDGYTPKKSVKRSKKSNHVIVKEKVHESYNFQNLERGMPEDNLLLWQRGYWGGIAQPMSVGGIANEVAIISGWYDVDGKSEEVVEQNREAIKNAPNRIRKQERVALQRWITDNAGAAEARSFLDARAQVAKHNAFNPWGTLLRYGNWQPSVTVDEQAEEDEADDEDNDQEADDEEEDSDAEDEGEDDDDDDEDVDMELDDGDADDEDLDGEFDDAEECEEGPEAGPRSSVQSAGRCATSSSDAHITGATSSSSAEDVQMSVEASGDAQPNDDDVLMLSPAPSDLDGLGSRFASSEISDGDEDDGDTPMPSLPVENNMPRMQSSEVSDRERLLYADPPLTEAENVDYLRDLLAPSNNDDGGSGLNQLPSSFIEGIFRSDDPEFDALMRSITGDPE